MLLLLSSPSSSLIIIKTYRSTIYVDVAYCCRPSSMVCWSVCHTSEPCKNSWTDRDVIWVQDLGWPREPCIRWGSRSPMGRGNFGERVPIIKYRDFCRELCKNGWIDWFAIWVVSGKPKEAHIQSYLPGGTNVHKYNRIRHEAPKCLTTLCRDLCKMPQPIDLRFRLLSIINLRSSTDKTLKDLQDSKRWQDDCQQACCCPDNLRHAAPSVSPALYVGQLDWGTRNSENI